MLALHLTLCFIKYFQAIPLTFILLFFSLNNMMEELELI